MFNTNLIKSQSRFLSWKTLTSVLFGVILVLICSINLLGQCNTGATVVVTPVPSGPATVEVQYGTGSPAIVVAGVPPGSSNPAGVEVTFPNSSEPSVVVTLPTGSEPASVTAFPGGMCTGEVEITLANNIYTCIINNTMFSGIKFNVPKNSKGNEFKINHKTKEITINVSSASTLSLSLTKKIMLKINGKSEDPGFTDASKNFELKMTKGGTIKIDTKNKTITITSEGATITKKAN